jgi:hypothetical protein
MMRVYDEALHAYGQEMIHRVRDDGASGQGEEWLRKTLGQRAKSQSQAGTQNKRRLKSSFHQS